MFPAFTQHSTVHPNHTATDPHCSFGSIKPQIYSSTEPCLLMQPGLHLRGADLHLFSLRNNRSPPRCSWSSYFTFPSRCPTEGRQKCNLLKRTNFVSPYSYDFNKLHKPFDLNGPLQCSNI